MTRKAFHLADYLTAGKVTREAIRQFALDTMLFLVDEGLLFDVAEFRFSPAKKWLGRFEVTSRGRRIVAIAGLYADTASVESIEDTVLHEIAHAMAWDNYRDMTHGPAWQTYAKMIGCSATRAEAVPEMPKGKYAARCATCGTGPIGWRWIPPRTEYTHKACGQVVEWEAVG